MSDHLIPPALIAACLVVWFVATVVSEVFGVGRLRRLDGLGILPGFRLFPSEPKDILLRIERFDAARRAVGEPEIVSWTVPMGATALLLHPEHRRMDIVRRHVVRLHQMAHRGTLDPARAPLLMGSRVIERYLASLGHPAGTAGYRYEVLRRTRDGHLGPPTFTSRSINL